MNFSSSCQYERFFRSDGVCVATVYAPISYPPQSVLVFNPEQGTLTLRLCTHLSTYGEQMCVMNRELCNFLSYFKGLDVALPCLSLHTTAPNTDSCPPVHQTQTLVLQK